MNLKFDEQMLCGTCVEPGKFDLTTVDMPSNAPAGWVLLDIQAVGICGTDYHIFEGKHPYLNYPRVIGHELSGRVVNDVNGWKQGDLVVVNPYISCGKCHACLRLKPNCCSNIQVLGVHRDGGLCARLAVPLTNIYAATGLSEIEAAMVEFLAIGAHAVRRSSVCNIDRVLVTGAGPIGLGTALFARLTGAEVHLLDVSETRLELISQKFNFKNIHVVGADLLIGDLADGFDVVFDATGYAKAMEAGFGYVAHGGQYIFVSVVKDKITFDDGEFHKREMSIIGSRNALKEDFDTVVLAIKNKQIDTSALASEILSLTEMKTRFGELVNDRETLIKAIVKL
ncbi:MAG: zinc-binding alcohol dehydrogenase family protein [Rhizobiales bacterium]|nr:zinc-binding alcohol dehydrogenase family protein [Hyphomicrobiales bacterium]